MMGSVTAIATIFFLLSSLVLASSDALERPPIVDGLSWNHYFRNCPRLETIVRTHLQKVFKKDTGQAPALLRIFFHDCFVQVFTSNFFFVRTCVRNLTSIKDKANL